MDGETLRRKPVGGVVIAFVSFTINLYRHSSFGLAYTEW